ncbi:hypothetical protein BZA05DRAFT_401242 [Tricharina praecox]|uniref:uncharacterized protein n=1 Tax=Tricharina praecox TaxID=43433 RepID=UPI00221FB83D|nr:uncharacterized protein BZA05DRAFT_401242 [Tricharina praecox]KAI5849706.1 hypothetical protein BZA05DRAFT_401242 [Tricharina praecox]
MGHCSLQDISKRQLRLALHALLWFSLGISGSNCCYLLPSDGSFYLGFSPFRTHGRGRGHGYNQRRWAGGDRVCMIVSITVIVNWKLVETALQCGVRGFVARWRGRRSARGAVGGAVGWDGWGGKCGNECVPVSSPLAVQKTGGGCLEHSVR